MIRKYEALAILGCFVIFAGVLIGCGAKEKKNLTGSTASSITTTGGGGGTTGGTATSQTTSQAAASATNTGVDSLTSVKTALSQLSGSSP
ncbi:MAG: hypothetical protein AABY84_06430 [Candidatus Firestonebacteria bacterium]